MDMEKVIKGLQDAEISLLGFANHFPPLREDCHKQADACHDALVLLKEQDKRFDYLFSKFAGHSDYHGDSVLSAIDNVKNGKIIDNVIPNEDNFSGIKAKYDCLLKEQENASKRNPVIVCPHCGKRVK